MKSHGSPYRSKLIVSVCLVCALITIAAPKAEAFEDTAERARIRLACALASMASYHDELNVMVETMLRKSGWTAVQYYKVSPEAEAKYTVFRTAENEAFPPMIILSFTGTESNMDTSVDVRMHRVPFGGKSPEEFRQTAEQEKHNGDTPLVHQGFNDYITAALFSKPVSAKESRTMGEYIADSLKANPDEKLYITGHSLGGAVAVIAAARLSDMGVAPHQLEVVTFGAPAVANESFAKAYGDKMRIERVIMQGDPVKYVFQAISGGYVQFGEKKYLRPLPESEHFPHRMVVYLDSILRDYYDILLKTEAALPKTDPLTNQPNIPAKIFVAAPMYDLDDVFKSSQPYIEMLLNDEISSEFEYTVFSKEETNLSNLSRLARAAGCDYVMVQSLEGKRQRFSENEFRLTLSESIYDLNGNLLSASSSSTAITNMTPLEAAAYVYEHNSDARADIFTATN